MATISKTPDGTYRAKIRKRGYPSVSRNFNKKTLAQRWALQVESEMAKGIFVSTTEAETTTMAELFDCYSEGVAPTKKSCKDIRYRIKLLNKHFGHLTLANLTSVIIKKYRDDRLKKVKSETVRKELGVLRRVVVFTQKELEIHLPKGDPMRLVVLPAKAKGRERRFLPGEEEKLLEAASTYGGYIPHLIRFALETGMRRGEMITLCWENVDFRNRVATLRDTKNGDRRVVPLSSMAIDVLQKLPRHITGRVFPIRANSVTQAFRRIITKSGISDFRFHDLRHEATSRLFERGFSVMEVSAITGHRDLGMLKRYTHLRAEDLAKKLG